MAGLYRGSVHSKSIIDLSEAAIVSFYFQTNPWDERYIHEVNRDSFSKMRSSDVFREQLDLDPKAPDTLFIVVGSDSGLLLKYLREQELAPGTAIVIVEDDSVYPCIVDERHTQPALSGEPTKNAGVHLYSASNWQHQVFNGQDKAWFLAGTVRLVQANCCMTDYLQRYLQLFREVRTAVDERRVDLRQRCGRKPFIEAQMINAADNVSAFRPDSTLGRENVAVVLGGGPSLNAHLDWVQSNREKVFIIAVSRLCEKLQSIGLIPDIVVSIDPQDYLYEVSRHGIQWSFVPLINSYYVAPRLLQQWRGPHYFIGERLPWDGLGDEADRATGYTGATVGHTAVVVAARLGFSTILMAGVDLCFSHSGSSHAAGTPEAALSLLPGQYDAQVTTYGGRKAGTSIVLQRSIADMDALGKLVNRISPVLFNISEEATLIDSIPFANRSDVVLPASAPAYIPEPYAVTSESLDSLGLQLQVARDAFDTIHSACDDQERLVESLSKECLSDFSMAVKVLDRLLSDGGDSLTGYLKAIEFHAANEIALLQSPAHPSTSKADSLEAVRQFLGVVQISCDQFRVMIDGAFDKVALRRFELEQSLNISALGKRWATENTPGRILRHSDAFAHLFTDAQEEEAAEQICAFERLLREDQQVVDAVLANDDHRIDSCLKSVVFLYNQKNLGELQQLSKAITDPEWPGNAIGKLVSGFVKDLQSRTEEAVECYESVISLCSDQLYEAETHSVGVRRLLEETLSRMAQLFLEADDSVSALSTMATLCEFCPHYITSYAELLAVVGDVDNALALLNLYRENYPDDWRAARQLAELHQLRGEDADARLAFSEAEALRTDSTGQQLKAA